MLGTPSAEHVAIADGMTPSKQAAMSERATRIESAPTTPTGPWTRCLQINLGWRERHLEHRRVQVRNDLARKIPRQPNLRHLLNDAGPIARNALHVFRDDRCKLPVGPLQLIGLVSGGPSHHERNGACCSNVGN